jgi:hypothetical protein
MKRLTQGSTSKPTPHGIYVVPAVADPNIATEAAWADPNVRGLLLRTTWRRIEPNQDLFDWTYFEDGLAAAKAHRKTVMMSISAGTTSPAWLKSKCKLSNTAKGDIPSPWDPTFRLEWAKVIYQFGARYDANPLVVSITMAGGGHGIECMFAKTPAQKAAVDAAGGIGIWVKALEQIIDEYEAAFPTTPVYIATGNNYPDNWSSMSQVVQYGLAHYPGRFGVQENALKVHYPSIGATTFPRTNVAFSAINLVGYQLAAPVGSRQEGRGTLSQILGNAIGAQWVQVYPADPATDEAACGSFNQRAK